VVQVAVGKEHGLFLTDEGTVYSWGGSAEHGKLGRVVAGTSEAAWQEPAPIVDFNKTRGEAEIIVQIACGAEHCLALSQKGTLYAWGWNKGGQLGVGLSPKLKEVRVPMVVPFADKEVRVKSCSCAPESSACVTTKGEVYVWGAISYYLFSQGQRYDAGETVAIPVKLRGVPHEESRKSTVQGSPFLPSTVALCREQIACTMRPGRLQDDLSTFRAAMKARSSHLLSITRNRDAIGRSDRGGADAFQTDAVRQLGVEFSQQMVELDRKVHELDEARVECQAQLVRIGRELTVCDQQDTALTESAADLEVKRSKLQLDLGGRSGVSRTLDIQLNDINHFKMSNKRGKMQLLAQRDEDERRNLSLMQEYSDTVSKKHQIEALDTLVAALRRGELITKSDNSSDDGLKVANSKRLELTATSPQELAGKGNFAGFREVLSISDRALNDISSALREVSATAQGSDAALLEEVLEANLKMRKEINVHIQEKLERADKGGPHVLGLQQYFHELQSGDYGGLSPRGSRKNSKSGGAAASGDKGGGGIGGMFGW